MAPPATPSSRFLALLVAAALLSVLALAAWLTPAPAGHGTHEQLRFRSGIGLQTCTWVALSGKPCPTCGMTTAFAHLADGDPLAAARAQPMGAALALAAATAFWIALHIALTGSNMSATLADSASPRLLWISLALLAASWVYKIVTWRG